MFKTTIQPAQKLFIFLLVFFVKNSAFSQITPVNTIDINAIYVPGSDYKQKDGQIENTEKIQKRLGFGYNFLLSQKVDTTTKRTSIWTGTLKSSYMEMSNKTSDLDLIPNRLFSSDFGIGNYRSMGKKWGMVSMFSVGINSDLEKINFNDLYINGGVLFIRNYSQRFSFGFGGFVINALNTPILLPGAFLNWQTDGKFKFNVNFPTEASAAYDLNKKLELKLALRFRNMSYDIENKAEPKKRSLLYTELPLGLEGKFKSKHFDLVLGGGYMLLRDFSVRERGIKNIYEKVPVNKMDGNLFINAGIRYRLKTTK